MLLTRLDRLAVAEIVGSMLLAFLIFTMLVDVFGLTGLRLYTCGFVAVALHGMLFSRTFDRLKARQPPATPCDARSIWPPDRIAINHDDYHASHVGHLDDGRQFFLTTPFDPQTVKQPGNEFVALFLFKPDGEFLEAKIDALGPRATCDTSKRAMIVEQRLRELGEVRFERIEVAPFHVMRFDTMFGLIPRPPEDEEESWTVELHPGNYMAFYEPFDSGEYDT